MTYKLPLFIPQTSTVAHLSFKTHTLASDDKDKQAMATLGTAPAAHAFSFILSASVIIIVGPDQQLLTAHESYLTLNSKFFKAAVNKEWSEEQAHFITLPEDDVETTTNYLTFTYGRGIPTQTINSMLKEGIGQWDLLVSLYILGDRRLDNCLRNAVIQELVHLSNVRDKGGIRHFMPASLSRTYFDATPEGSPTRRLIIDVYVFIGRKGWLTSSGEEHPDFLPGLS
jgi:hypothetical protein